MCSVLTTGQMCNQVKNPSDTDIFSNKPTALSTHLWLFASQESSATFQPLRLLLKACMRQEVTAKFLSEQHSLNNDKVCYLQQCFSNYLRWQTGSFFQSARDRQAKQAGPLLLFLSFLENIHVPADDGMRTITGTRTTL